MSREKEVRKSARYVQTKETITPEFQNRISDLMDGGWRNSFERMEQSGFSGAHVPKINSEGEEC